MQALAMKDCHTCIWHRCHILLTGCLLLQQHEHIVQPQLQATPALHLDQRSTKDTNCQVLLDSKGRDRLVFNSVRSGTMPQQTLRRLRCRLSTEASPPMLPAPVRTSSQHTMEEQQTCLITTEVGTPSIGNKLMIQRSML